MSNMLTKTMKKRISRRTFLKASAAVGGVITASGLIQTAGAQSYGEHEPDPTSEYQTIRSYCLMCHSDCGIQARVKDGVALKLEGNPYSANSYDWNATDYSMSGGAVATDTVTGLDDEIGSLCAKGQAGLNTLYDPFRIKHPLKRVGPRGSGQWQTISWDKALSEIATGGVLFAGEPAVSGLKDIYNVASQMMSGASATSSASTEYSDYMAEAPSGTEGYGKRANQFVFYFGRNEQKDFTERFAKKSFGSTNHLGHTSICESSQKVGSEWTFTNVGAPTSDPLGKGKDHYKPDFKECTYLFNVGCNHMEAGFTFQTMARWINDAVESFGPSALVTMDPRFSVEASKSSKWIPIKPGEDTAFLFGVIRRIIDQAGYAADYLSRPNAAAASGYSLNSSFTDATYLVDDATGEYLRDAGVVQVTTDSLSTTAFSAPTTAVLDFTGNISTPSTTADATTVFKKVKDIVSAKTISEWAALCGTGITSGDIVEVADNLVAADRPCADVYKGITQKPGGANNAKVVYWINMLLDRIGRQGGFGGGGNYDPGSATVPSDAGTKGPAYDRHGKQYEAQRDGAPSSPTRPWLPLANHGAMQEVVPSILDGYPYKCLAIMTYYVSTGHTMASALTERSAWTALGGPNGEKYKIPLLVGIDIRFGENVSEFDYILPDTTYLERSTVGHVPPTVKTKLTQVRQPVVGDFSVVNRSTIDPAATGTTYQYNPINPDTRMVEDILIPLALKIGLPNFGATGMGADGDLCTAYDYYDARWLKGYTGLGDPNLRDKVSADRDFKKIGGKFQDTVVQYTGDGYLPSNFKGKLITFYSELWAVIKNMSAPGQPSFEPLAEYIDGDTIRLSNYTEVDDAVADANRKFQINTYKPAWHTQSRTMADEWLRDLWPENVIEINGADAGNVVGGPVADGDLVKVTSVSNDGTSPFSFEDKDIKMRIKLSNHVSQGTASISHSFGHYQQASVAQTIDGVSTGSDPTIGAGFNSNTHHRYDSSITGSKANVTDPIGGGALQYGTKIKLEKA